MATFLPCPDCGRHVRTSEHGCPFCGHGESDRLLVGRILSPLPELLPALILGMSLAACDGPRPAEKYGGPPPRPEVKDPDKTITDEAGADAEGGNVGEDAGDEAGPEPRPTEKYGAPPPPDDKPEKIVDEPADDKPADVVGEDQASPKPRSPRKYGAPPPPSDTPDKPGGAPIPD